MRTWAPRGQTPVLQFHFNWKTLSLMAGITWWNVSFRLFPGSIKTRQIIEFLTHLLRHPRRPLLVIWDGLPGRGGPRTSDRLLRWDPDPGEGVWNATRETELSG